MHPELDITKKGKPILITSKKNPKYPLFEEKKKSAITAV